MYRQSERNLLNSNIASTRFHNMSNFNLLTAEIIWRVWDTPIKFQLVSRLGFVTAATSFNGGQPIFARCLVVSLAGTLYIHLRGLLPLDGILPGATSLCVQVLRSPLLAALLHGSQPVGVSQTLRHGSRNGITELSQTAPAIFGWAAITLGMGPHSSFHYRPMLYYLLTVVMPSRSDLVWTLQTTP